MNESENERMINGQEVEMSVDELKGEHRRTLHRTYPEVAAKYAGDGGTLRLAHEVAFQLELMANALPALRGEYAFKQAMLAVDSVKAAEYFAKAKLDKQRRFEQSRCCELAEEIGCVCRFATKCIVHGEQHVGGHD